MKENRAPIWIAFAVLMFIVAHLAIKVMAQTNIVGDTNAPPASSPDAVLTPQNLWKALGVAAAALIVWYARAYWPKIKAKLPGDKSE